MKHERTDGHCVYLCLLFEYVTYVLVMFKKRAGVFLLRVFLNGFKNIPRKACVNRVHNNYAFVNVGNKRARKTPHTNEECFISR